jgi:hypothetical protein
MKLGLWREMSPDGFRDDIWQQVCNIMNARVEGLVSYLVHTQEKSDSVSEPAPNENRKSDVRIAEVPDAVETESERNEGLRKGNAEADRGQDE